jgi:hypothetical protein
MVDRIIPENIHIFPVKEVDPHFGCLYFTTVRFPLPLYTAKTYIRRVWIFSGMTHLNASFIVINIEISHENRLQTC